MNERDELALLKEQQARLEQELSILAVRLRLLETRLQKSELKQAAPSEDQERYLPKPAAPIGLSPTPPATPAKTFEPVQPKPAEPPRLDRVPPVISPAAVNPPTPEPATQFQQSTTAPQPAEAAKSASPPMQRPAPSTEKVSPPPLPTPPGLKGTPPGSPPILPPQREPSAAPAKKRSLELQLGTYWAPRVGIVVLLTGLVFIGNLAYQTMGPLGKVLLLYAASAILLGAGSWWQGTAKETLKNYAQVLFAGGLAALYFTTYAAHHLESLRVIDSTLLDGVLLLGCAGFMVYTANRWKSEILAIFGTGLAYYTCVMTRVGYFTLYSNLVLTLAAVFFLVRNRWVALTYGSLVASYAAYCFWSFFNGTSWHWASPSEGLWSGTYFLISYWVVFTVGVFFSREEKFAGENRATFLTLNNGAFFTSFLLTMLQVNTGGFWKFCLVYGGVLLVLAETANRVLTKEPLAKNFYLTQGLLLVTIGLISKFAGLQLALILAAESIVVLMMGHERKNLVLQAGAYIIAALAVAWGIDGMKEQDPAGIYLGCGLGALMLVDSLIVHRKIVRGEKTVLRPQVSYFVVLALIAWAVTTWNNTARDDVSLVLAAEGALFALSIYLLRVPELTFFGLVYLLLTQINWSLQVINAEFWPGWWNPVLVLGLAISLSYWWQKQAIFPLRQHTDDPWPVLDKAPAAGKNLVLLASAYLAAKLAGVFNPAFTVAAAHQFYLPIALGVMMLADLLLADRRLGPTAKNALRFQPSYSAIMVLLTWLALTWRHTEATNFPLVLATEGLLLTFSFYLLRVRELTLLSQGYIILAQLAWVLIWLDHKEPPPWWNPVLLIGMTLMLSHWWQKQKVLALSAESSLFWQGLYGLAIVGVLSFWLSRIFGAPTWLVLTSLLALGLTAYGILTRAWLLAACGQIFTLVAGVQFAVQVWEGQTAWPFALAPLAALAVLSWGTVWWFAVRPGADARVREPLLQLAMLYRWVALVMTIGWVCQYIPLRDRIWVFSALGLAAFVVAGWSRSQEALLFTAVFTVLGLLLFWTQSERELSVYFPNLAAILVLLVAQQAAKRLPERYAIDARVHGTIIFIGGVTLWLFCTRWVLELASGFYLTASWSLLALVFFTCGIVVRERVYRWLGLGLLACALGRIVIFDVWKLETLYRILSFMALGIVLLVLGFVYSKYQEKIKEWL